MMIYVRLLATAAAALMVLAGTASATTVTSSAGSTPTIQTESEGATTIHGVVDVTCSNSTTKGTVASHGSGVTAKGSFTLFVFTICGNNHVTVINAGAFEFHAIPPTGNYTVTSSGLLLRIVVTALGITCDFSTNNTYIGTGTSAANNGGVQTIHVDSASIPRTGGSVFCGSSGEWTGSYKVTSPSSLEVHS